MSRPTTRNTPAATALKPVGLPRPVEVRTDADGLPAAVVARLTRGRHAGLVRVESIEEAWRVAEEWWREAPLERTYYLLLLEDGRPITVFHDGIFDAWFEQQY
jgi:hypothetical protein